MLIAPALLLFLAVGVASCAYVDRDWLLTIVFHRHWGWGYLVVVAQACYAIYRRWEQVVEASRERGV